MSSGLFVVFEGGDGVGKSTQVQLLVERLRDAGVEVVRTFEPGDSLAGKEIRRIVLSPETGDLDPRAEALLYAADKAQHLYEVVRPALGRGAVVVCDRYVDSMLAYQGAGRVLDVDEVEQMARWATADLRPDLTVLLDTDPYQSVQTKINKDRLEGAGAEFHERVRAGFQRLAQSDPGHYLVLDARRTIEEIAEAVWTVVQNRLDGGTGGGESVGGGAVGGGGETGAHDN
ncbi:dTMP kinase [Propionibacteriaceae bacterium Y1700]|uniref:dTMP kinase n=1 Tax=Microlunatus sp. Y1700 TaxID=3418487 RepID=UPI003DA785F7